MAPLIPMHSDERWSILSLSTLPDFVNDILRRDFELTIEEGPLDPPALKERCTGRQVILLSVDAPLSAPHIAALPGSVRAVATYSVGLDHLDVEAIRARGLALFNTPDVLTNSVAEVAMFHVLAVLRRAGESLQLIRSGSWSGWTPRQLLGLEAYGKHLGIFGMGRIGRAVAQRARAFGMCVHYCNRHRLPEELEAGATFHAEVDGLLGAVDVLLIAAPADIETRGFLNRQRIAQLRRGASVVNIARGDLVDDDALIEALERGDVSAAGLDVFRNEPDLDARYLSLPNVFMTPHIGSSTIEARRRMAEILLEGINLWRRGGVPVNRVV